MHAVEAASERQFPIAGRQGLDSFLRFAFHTAFRFIGLGPTGDRASDYGGRVKLHDEPIARPRLMRSQARSDKIDQAIGARQVGSGVIEKNPDAAGKAEI
jgi:hypothetical protein